MPSASRINFRAANFTAAAFAIWGDAIWSSEFETRMHTETQPCLATLPHQLTNFSILYNSHEKNLYNSSTFINTGFFER